MASPLLQMRRGHAFGRTNGDGEGEEGAVNSNTMASTDAGVNVMIVSSKGVGGFKGVVTAEQQVRGTWAIKNCRQLHAHCLHSNA